MCFRSLRLGMRLLPHQATEPVPKRLEAPGTVRLDVHMYGYLGGGHSLRQPRWKIAIPLPEVFERLPRPADDRVRIPVLRPELWSGGQAGVRRPRRGHVPEKPRLEFLGHYAVQHGPACPTVSGAERTEAGISSRLLQHALQLHAVVIVAVDENDDSGVGATDPRRVTSEPSRDLRQHLGLVAEWIDSRIVPRSDDLRYQLG